MATVSKQHKICQGRRLPAVLLVPNLARFRMELAQEGSGRRVEVTFRVTVPDSLKFRILKVNEAERYTLIAVEPDSLAASTEDTSDLAVIP